jgi:hypothetical protein
MEDNSSENDLLLAKRRMVVMFPFLLINFIFSIVMVISSVIVRDKMNEIRNEYKIGENDYNYDLNIEECVKLGKQIKESKIKNITEAFKVNTDDLKKVYQSVDASFVFSITCFGLISLFLVISICLTYKYARFSDEKIKENPDHTPNNKHYSTNCFYLVKITILSLFEIFLLTSFFLTISKFDTKLFQNIYYFADKCVTNKESFKKKYSNFWEIKIPLNMYYIFIILFIVSDITSIVLKKLAKKYNIWSLILSLITCKKHKYIEIENSKGFIIPQEKDAKDNDIPNNIGEIIN